MSDGRQPTEASPVIVAPPRHLPKRWRRVTVQSRVKLTRIPFPRLAAFCLPLVVGAWMGTTRAAADGVEFFESKVRPILVEHCYKCHSADRGRSKGGLSLDSAEGLRYGGDSGPAVAPGDPDASRLILAVRYQDANLQMPPKEKLTPGQIADLEAWVKLGAPDPRSPRTNAAVASPASSRFWAFQPPKDAPIPRVRNRKWAQDPIDFFILSELEDRRLKPAPPADRRTLIRRATFDLIGLPPTPAEIDAFLADNSTNAWAHVLDRLLDSPHFGERWGRHWLDVVRYADSNGTEFNLPYPNAWRYRDYVVDALNRDKPFDQFVREQLAGDLLSARSEDERFAQLTATGFLMLGPKALFEPNRTKLEMDIVDEQIDVTTRAFLGLTVSCARCHDHKFDPIPTRDYYALAGIFRSTTTLVENRTAPDALGPLRWLERPLADPARSSAIEKHQTTVAALQAEREKARTQRMNFPGNIDSARVSGVVVDNLAAEITGPWRESVGSTNFVDRNYLADGNADKGKKRVRFVPNLPKAGLYQVLVSYTPLWNRATNVPVTIEFDGGTTNVAIDQTLPPTTDRIFLPLGKYRFAAGTNGAVSISNFGTKGFVVADAARFVPVGDAPVMDMAARMTPPTMTSGLPEFVMQSPDFDALDEKLADLLGRAPAPMPTVMAVKDGLIVNCRINLRGDSERLGEEIPRGFISCAGGGASDRSDASGRLELAGWIARPGNPLTARVAVNRIWLHLIGRGLVQTPDNLGALSEPPTHPELLDHLALRFVKQGWSVKRIVRAIMRSSTYQMSSSHDSVAAARDPDNHWLWHMNRRRLEAEAIADSLLALSGRLDLTMGGSVMPTNDPQAQIISGQILPELTTNRRALYRPVIRNSADDLLQVFDFPDPQVVSGKRHSTAAPTQALFMLNSPFATEHAGLWAESILRDPVASDTERVHSAYIQSLGRPPTRAESLRAMAYLENEAQRNSSDPGTADLRRVAWRNFCHALLACTEFRFLD
ncbi:MAG: DUF1549 domain-containing protein [Pedosphaera sp.]|nr:DUF1549 domain-containing protein [Pedosphaera sp.]